MLQGFGGDVGLEEFDFRLKAVQNGRIKSADVQIAVLSTGYRMDLTAMDYKYIAGVALIFFLADPYLTLTAFHKKNFGSLMPM